MTEIKCDRCHKGEKQYYCYSCILELETKLAEKEQWQKEAVVELENYKEECYVRGGNGAEEFLTRITNLIKQAEEE